MIPLAQFQAVTRSYGSGNTAVTALRNIDLDLFAGQLTLIEGPSGCGKTTLLEVLGLLLPPSAGKVFIEGKLVSGLGQRKSTRLRRRHVAFVFQDFNLLESLIARDNIEIVARLHGPDARIRTREVLHALGLANRAHHRPSELSGGEKQRVAIGRAMVSDAPLLLADEPTANLDWAIGESIVKTLSDIAHNQNRAVVVVSHDPRLEPYADRVISLLDGSIAAQRRAGRATAAIVVIMAVIAAALGGWVMVIRAGDSPSTQPAHATMPTAIDEQVIASAPAVTEPPSRLIQLSCDRTGIITAINAQSGEQVARDQVLVQLDDTEARTNWHLSLAQLASAKATLADLQAWTRPEEIEQSKADVEADKARLAFAQSQYDRLNQLLPASAAAVQDVDRARQNLDVSKAELHSAQAALAKAIDGPTATALAQAQAHVTEAQAAVEVARTALDRRQLRSPVDGVVLYVYMRPGEAIDLESPQPILSLAQAGAMHLRADVDEADIGKIFLGQKVRASSESFDQTFNGKVISMEPIMGRRNIKTNRPRERQDTRIREVVIEVTDDSRQLPIDLMMTVRFLAGGKRE